MMHDLLERLKAEDNLRQLPHMEIEGKYVQVGGKRLLNLSSNDYLGLSCAGLDRDFMRAAADDAAFLLSNPSSRLVTGNSAEYRRLEERIAAWYGQGTAALVVGCGYMANSGVLPALTDKHDLILADKLVHASLIDGLRLSEATWKRFAHNDMEHLRRLLDEHRAAYRNVWIVTESVFSMDGDRAPLVEMAELKRRYAARLYVDEAHAFGVCGAEGRGGAERDGIETDCDVRILTFGKSLASEGACVLTDPETREVLVNRMRTLIFTTALPPLLLRWSEYLIGLLPQMNARRQHLGRLSEMLSGERDHTQIIPIMCGENHRALALSERFREAGYWVSAIRYPTVPQGTARIRVSLSAALSDDEIRQFTELCRSIG